MEDEKEKKDEMNPAIVGTQEPPEEKEPENFEEQEVNREEGDSIKEVPADDEDEATRLQTLIAEAEARGELRGRNAKIAELMKEIHDSDGLPHPSAGQGAKLSPRPSNIFDLAREAW